MVMIFWWVTALLLLAALAVWAITFWNRRAMRKSPVLVANSSYMDRIPSFVRAQRTTRVVRVLQVAIAVIGLFGDAIVAAVEARHYPAAHAVAREVGFVRSGRMALASAARALGINLAMTPVYLALLFTAIGPAIAFFLVNGWLLGRDLGDMVASRHMDDATMRGWRKATRGQRFVLGLAVAGLFVVPLANLFAPILGAAMATHLFHGGEGDTHDDAHDLEPRARGRAGRVRRTGCRWSDGQPASRALYQRGVGAGDRAGCGGPRPSVRPTRRGHSRGCGAETAVRRADLCARRLSVPEGE